MADLLDIAPSTAVESVLVGGQPIDVSGLHLNAIAAIAARFPDLALLLAGGADVVTRLIRHVGVAVGPIIAAGCGHLGDERYEQRASALLVEDQIKLVTAIYRLTFPNGLAALIETITSLGPAAAKNEEKKSVRVRLKNSPSPPPPSSDGASRSTMQ